MSEVALLEKSAVRKTNPELGHYQATGMTCTRHPNCRPAQQPLFRLLYANMLYSLIFEIYL
jgi:hypothetical protein